MNTLDLFKGVGIIYAIAYFLSSLAAHAEEPQRLVTIADCPSGYVLGVQETDQPQLMAKTPSANPSDASAEAKETTEAPRRFVTGCVAKQPSSK
ncbi:MAG: hypothetical protein WAO98_00215 [Alphaproteobacteria bacterium]